MLNKSRCTGFIGAGAVSAISGAVSAAKGAFSGAGGTFSAAKMIITILNYMNGQRFPIDCDANQTVSFFSTYNLFSLQKFRLNG